MTWIKRGLVHVWDGAEFPDDPFDLVESARQFLTTEDVDHIALERRAGGDTDVRLTTIERRELVLRLHAEGVNDRDIERQTGIRRETVERIRKRLDLQAVGRTSAVLA